MGPVLEGAGLMLGYPWAHHRSWVEQPLLTWPSCQPLPLLPMSKAPQMGHRARRRGTRMGVSAVASPCFMVWAVSSPPWASVSWSFSPNFMQLKLSVRPQLPTRHQRRFSAGAAPSCSDLVQGWACKLGIYQHGGTSQVAQRWRICLPMQETWEMQVWSLGQKDPLEKEMATHSSILA